MDGLLVKLLYIYYLLQFLQVLVRSERKRKQPVDYFLITRHQ